MTNHEYHSAVYKINSNKKTATRMIIKDYACSILPKELSFDKLINILVKMQEKCFDDKNENNENTNRIKHLFLSKENKTIIVALSLGYLDGVTDYMDFVDGGAATVQKSNLDFLDYQQPWINEVCRANINKVSSHKSPVTIVMEMVEKYIETQMKTSKRIDGLYLYVEKKPEHGNSDFLLKYYQKYGFTLLKHEDDEYFYMHKPKHNKVSSKNSLAKKGTKRSTRKLSKI
jgi:hypothetical protein